MTQPAARVQVALNVADLDAAIEFYTKAFGVGVNKREPGYANFVVEHPALKLVLFEAPDAGERLNHLGVEVFDDAEVAEASARLDGAALEHLDQQNEVCCFAEQNKVITHDPQGLMWEWYRVLKDAPSRSCGCC